MSNAAVNPRGPVRAFNQVLRPVASLDQHRPAGSRAAEAMEAAREQGHQEGFSAGYRLGQAQAFAEREAELRAELEATIQRLEAAVPQALQNWLNSTEGALTKLAVAIAAQAIGAELRTPETVATMVRSALSEVVQAKSARIRVNPFDADLLAPIADSLAQAGSSVRHVEIVRDPSILGGCLVETDGGAIDARVDRILDHALHDLRRVV